MAIRNLNTLFNELDLAGLKYFYNVAFYGGFSKASRATKISQPALSLGLQKLEKTLRVNLIARDSKQFSLTKAGIHLLDFCQHLEGELGIVIKKMGGKDTLSIRRLRIGTAFSIGFGVIVKICNELKKDFHQDIELEVVEENSYQLLNDLNSGLLDFAIVPDDVTHSKIDFKLLFKDQIILIASPAIEKKYRDRPWKSIIEELPLLTYPRETAMRHLVDQISIKEKLIFKNSISANGVEGLKMMTSESMGVAFVLKMTVTPELDSGTLMQIQTHGMSLPKRGLMLATRKQNEDDPIIALIIKGLAK